MACSVSPNDMFLAAGKLVTILLTVIVRLRGQTTTIDPSITTDFPCERAPVKGYSVAPDGVTEIRVGVIVISGYGAPYDIQRSGAAIQLAIEHVNKYHLNDSYRIVKIERHYGPSCDAADAPGIAADLFYNVGIAVLVGPGCTYALDPVGRLAGYWNIPIITGVGDSGMFREKVDYPTLTRMAYCQCRLRKVFGSVFAKFNWTTISLIRSRDDVHASVLGETLDVGLKKQNIHPHVINFYKDDDLRHTLQSASDVSRIIILSVSGDQVRSFMLTAREMGFTNGHYVFMDVELFKFKGEYWGDHDWKRGDADDPLAMDAYNALLRVALYEPKGNEFQQFSIEVTNRSKTMYNFTYGNEKVNFFVGAFYDAVIHYGQALNETLDMGGDILDGRRVSRQMWNRTFTGITEEVKMDDNGDRDTSYSILDMVKGTGEFEAVAHYWGSNPGYSPVSGVSIYWGEDMPHPPPNTPPCWYKNDNPSCIITEAMSPVMIGIVSVLCTIILGGVLGFLAYRKYQTEAELRDMTWVIDVGDVKNRRTTYMSSMSAMSVVSGKSHDTSTMSEMSKGRGAQLYTDTALYRGQKVAMRQLKKRQINMNRNLLVEVKWRRTQTHDNIVKFIGAVIDPPKIVLLHEYCPKGSLQDLLANETIGLDNVFKMSLIEDIVKGMEFIHHNSHFGIHGRLRSSNCVVDNRFVLKLTDFGLPAFYEDEQIDESEDEFTYYSQLLWVAPEILRDEKNLVKFTPKADVYSFGIILEEIILRAGPYDTARAFMEPKEIIAKVKLGGDEPLRPMIPKDQCSPQLRELMRRCVSEDPNDRPDFHYIKNSCRKISGGRETNLLDNLLKRMEQYANNLEGIVAERTGMLVQEQKKTEQLLLQILPRSIMEQLKAGKTVDPEWFDEVSIYFSDIVGFTTISAGSTPIQVVNMLNDLYTTFDAVLEKFDVYKVETIGDAYMVASGLPIRNGHIHGREIARMSMALLSSISEFKIRHLPEESLRLRIGLHSGPVCAGVVGHKMPRYCLFGDTVNTASRMESNGLPLKIHISDSTMEVLEEFNMFNIELRGDLEIKGKGKMRTYWLLGEKTM